MWKKLGSSEQHKCPLCLWEAWSNNLLYMAVLQVPLELEWFQLCEVSCNIWISVILSRGKTDIFTVKLATIWLNLVVLLHVRCNSWNASCDYTARIFRCWGNALDGISKNIWVFSPLSSFLSPLFSASYFHEIYGKVLYEDFFPWSQSW